MLELRRYLGVAVAVPFVVGGALAAVPEGERRVVLTLTDPAIVESSGLVARNGQMVTTNDSGDQGRVFTVDTGGRTVGTTTWGEARDVEALAPLDGDVLVGDIGDNAAERDSVSILRVRVGAGELEADAATAVELVYPEGPRDAETLMVDPVSGRVLIASKAVLGGALYEVPPDAVPPAAGAPAPVEPVRLREIGSVRAVATDGAFFPDGRHLVVRGYGSATVYSWPDLQDVGSFDLPEQEQGEGIAVEEVERGFRVLVSSEGVDSEVLLAPLPQALAEAVAPLPGGAEPAQPEGPVVVTPPGAYESPVASDALDTGPGVGPWLVGGVFLLAVLVVLLRSLRPR